MGTITLPNFRVSGTDRARVRLKDGGVYVEWSTMTDIKAWLYSVEQKAISGRFDVQVDPQDGTCLVCVYSAQKPQYLGVNKIILQCKYEGADKAYDKPLWNFVRWTADQAGEEVAIDDPEVDVEIVVTDVESSILDGAIQAALDAAELATAKAELAAAKAALAAAAADAANAAALLADAKAALAAAKAELADDAATNANTKAALANSKAALAAEKAQAAQDAADLAQQKAALAVEAAELATQKAALAASAASAANNAADAASTAADNANTKATLANTKAGYAQDQGDYAKAQGDYAKGQIDGAKGTFESLDERLTHNEQISMYLEETTDPTNEHYRDEYLRVLAVLYQAITDAKAAIAQTEAATFDANSAAGAATAAVMQALQAAGMAEEMANLAQAAAAAATAAMNAAKGNYGSLNERLVAIEAGKQDVIEDLSEIRSGAAVGRTAYQKPADGIPGTDLDETTRGSLSKAESAVQPGDLNPVASSGNYQDLSNKPANLSEFTNNVAVVFVESEDPLSIYR